MRRSGQAQTRHDAIGKPYHEPPGRAPRTLEDAPGSECLPDTLRPVLERRLKTAVGGDIRFDRFTRGRYATDASHYQIMPVGVVAPRTIEDASRAIEIAREEGVSVLARGGGTSQCGQTVNASLVIDCSK